MVGAQQKRAAAGVGVGVADFLGAAAPSSDRDEHFESLHAQTDTSDKKRLAYNTIRTGRRITTAIATKAGLHGLCVRGTFINNPKLWNCPCMLIVLFLILQSDKYLIGTPDR